jgi:pyochelin biosynthesis protein PchC
MTAAELDRWLAGWWRRSDKARPLLVGVPPGSRGPEVMAGWSAALPSTDVVGVQLPGRGARLFETPVADLRQLAELVTECLLDAVPDNWVLAGHCSGTYLALEIAHRMAAAGQPPVRLVLSSSRSPSGLTDPASEQSEAAADVLDASDDELAARLRERGRLPGDLDEPEVVAAVLAAYRAAVRAAVTYRCTLPPVDVATDLWWGRADDTVSGDHLRDWRRYLSTPPREIEFAGARQHFEQPLPAAVRLVEEMVRA